MNAELRVLGPVRELHRSPEHRAADGFDVTVAVSFASSADTIGETIRSLVVQQGAPTRTATR